MPFPAIDAPNDDDVVIVEALRTPIGRRRGRLAGVHPADLLGAAMTATVERSGIDPSRVEQVVGGCVSQIGEQSFNITRTAALAAGLPLSVAATTVDTQCGSSQQAAGLAAGLIASGVTDVAMACGVEAMSRVPIGSNSSKKLGFGVPIPKTYFGRYEFTSQFEGAERIADAWGISREDADRFALASQERAAAAWKAGKFETQIVPVTAPILDEQGAPTGEVDLVGRDGGLRDTSLEGLSALAPVARPDGVHTAGSASQISDGAAAILLMRHGAAKAAGLTPLARVVDSCLVGVDPVLMLTGPIDATRRLLGRTGLSIGDIGVFEINEAFASVVLAWQREVAPSIDPALVNPNGGAIALGHPLGATGVILLTKAVHELHESDSEFALVSMCCGGGLGTGTLLQRL